jgi:hypothetical protein
MRIIGKCHCGNVAFDLDWEGGDAPEGMPHIAARACGCTFCVKHGGVWTAHPQAKLRVRVRDPAQVTPYVFGTRTATFHVCSRCGVVPVVTCTIDGRLHAVVNVNTFENVEPKSIQRAAVDFEGEDTTSRLARRARNWIADVSFAA